MCWVATFVSQYCNGDVDTDSAVELGIGFCPASQLPNQYFPCLAFCIWGDFQQFVKFVKRIADVIIIERDAGVGPNPSLQGLPNSIKCLYWEVNCSHNGVNKKTSELWGSFTYVANILQMFLRIQCPREHNSLGRPALLEECLNGVCSVRPPRPGRHIKLDEDEMVKAFTTPKSALQLQESYVREPHFYFDAIKFRSNPPEQAAREKVIHPSECTAIADPCWRHPSTWSNSGCWTMKEIGLGSSVVMRMQSFMTTALPHFLFFPLMHVWWSSPMKTTLGWKTCCLWWCLHTNDLLLQYIQVDGYLHDYLLSTGVLIQMIVIGLEQSSKNFKSTYNRQL